jgi:radical SAM superfamily enzyme YgiQ (UPF0313 family)
MIGFPHESEDQIRETLDYAVAVYNENKNSTAITYIFISTPLPGTRLYSYCKENNLIFPGFDWEENPYIYQYEKAKIGKSLKGLHKIEQLREDYVRQCNSRKISLGFLDTRYWNTKLKKTGF